MVSFWKRISSGWGGTGLRTCILKRALVLQDRQLGKMESKLIANGKSRPNNLSLHGSSKHVG
jgi:hypothetical protein